MTLKLQNHVISVGNPIPYTKFERFGIIRVLSYAPDKQTNKQTESIVILTPTL